MRVRVLQGIFYGHRPDRDPEFDADPDNPVIARGLEHSLLEAVSEPEPEVSPIGEAEAEKPKPAKAATRRRKAT